MKDVKRFDKGNGSLEICTFNSVLGNTLQFKDMCIMLLVLKINVTCV